MSKSRLESFTDAVIAILITIMVLDLSAPKTAELSALLAIAPRFLSYVLSFVFLGIYWTNHHHMLHLCDRINGRILWANLFLLFWLSLVPFTTSWIGESHFASLPMAMHGFVLLLAGIAFVLLRFEIMAQQGPSSRLRAAVGSDRKGVISIALCMAAIPLAFVHQIIAGAIYVAIALMWLVPDRRIEHELDRTLGRGRVHAERSPRGHE